MYQIVYASMANRDFSGDDLKKLLLRARMRNKIVGVTGMLVFRDGTFLQALEGEKTAVLDLFTRIKSDPRHRDFSVLHHGAGPSARVFGDWLLPQLGISLGTGIVPAIINATIGAVLLLFVVRLLRGGFGGYGYAGGWGGGWGRRRWW